LPLVTAHDGSGRLLRRDRDYAYSSEMAIKII